MKKSTGAEKDDWKSRDAEWAKIGVETNKEPFTFSGFTNGPEPKPKKQSDKKEK